VICCGSGGSWAALAGTFLAKSLSAREDDAAWLGDGPRLRDGRSAAAESLLLHGDSWGLADVPSGLGLAATLVAEGAAVDVEGSAASSASSAFSGATAELAALVAAEPLASGAEVGLRGSAPSGLAPRVGVGVGVEASVVTGRPAGEDLDGTGSADLEPLGLVLAVADGSAAPVVRGAGLDVVRPSVGPPNSPLTVPVDPPEVDGGVNGVASALSSAAAGLRAAEGTGVAVSPMA
jgi:hypothetical protein